MVPKFIQNQVCKECSPLHAASLCDRIIGQVELHWQTEIDMLKVKQKVGQSHFKTGQYRKATEEIAQCYCDIEEVQEGFGIVSLLVFLAA